MPASVEHGAGRREWIGLLVLSAACLLYSMDLSVLFLAMPAIVADLQPTAIQLLWINDIYGFMVAGLLVTMGSLGDRYGRRRILLIGAAAFGLASVLAACAQSASQLIAARALLGIAGATIAPSTLSLVVNLFSVEAERSRAIGIWGMAFALGGLVGPLIGGLLLEFFHWGAVFLINVPIMLGLLILGPVMLPEHKADRGVGIDVLSVLQSLASVLALIYGLKRLAVEGFAPIALLALTCGLLLGIAFVRRQRRLSDPLIDLALFRIPAFSASLLVNLCGVFFVFGIFLFQNLFLQLVLDLTPLQAAIWSAVPSMVFTVMSLQAHRVSRRFGPVNTVLGGLVVNACATLLMAVAAHQQNLGLMMMSSALIGAGFVPVVLTTTGLIVGSAPTERAGAASAISETSAELGGAMGVALLGSLAALVYRLSLQQVDVSALPPEFAAVARHSLAGAVDIARALGMESAAWLTEARKAFALGFALCCLLASLSLLLLASLAQRVFRGGAPLVAAQGH